MSVINFTLVFSCLFQLLSSFFSLCFRPFLQLGFQRRDDTGNKKGDAGADENVLDTDDDDDDDNVLKSKHIIPFPCVIMYYY